MLGTLLATLASAPQLIWSPAAGARIAGCHAYYHVLAHRAGGVVVRLPRGARRPVACGSQTGYASSESSIAVTNASLVYSPAETENTMARSSNGGAGWGITYPAEEQYTSFWNTVDPYVIADRRTGRVFWTHATGPVRNEQGLPQGAGFYLAGALGFQVYTSTDEGRTFTTADYQTAPTGDWEKLFVGPPPPASTGQPQPTGYPDIVYECANSPVEVAGPGRLCYKSLDGGATFQLAGFTSPTVSNPTDVCPPLNFNTGVVDSQGAMYQPVDCEHSAYVVVSRDEGESETWLPEPDAPTGTPTSGTNLKLAVDDADNLYAMWSSGGLLYMAVSRDHAQTWSAPMMVAAPGVHNVQLPAIAAGAPGEVAMTYYASTDPSAQMFSAYVTQSADATDAQPLFYSGPINDPSQPIFHDYGLTGGSPRTDFIGGEFDPAGTTFWAGVVEQLGPAVSSENSTQASIPTSGYVGTLRFGAKTPASLP